jgi:hypothetical protein
MLKYKKMQQNKYNFENKSTRQKATEKSLTSTRPKTYHSKRKRVEEVKKELIKQELLRSEFIQQIGAVLPQINAALIKSAISPKGGSADRKLVYKMLGFIDADSADDDPQTIGQVLADLMKTS